MGRTGRVLSGLVVGGAFLLLAFHGVALGDLGDAFRDLDARWFVPAIALSLLLQVFRTWRWQLELRPLAHVPFGRLWVVTSVAYMAIQLLPLRLGEVVRPWLLSRRSSLSFSNVAGNVIVEKTTFDPPVLMVYILVGLLTTSNLPTWARRGAVFPALLFGGLATLVVLLWCRGEHAVARWVARWLPERLGERVVRIARALVDGMRVLGNPRLVLAVFAVSLVLWFIPIVSSWVMIKAFRLPVPFNAALLVFIFIGFGTALPQAPGMVGTIQLASVLALEVFGVSRPQALAYGLVLNALQLSTIVAQGLVALPLAGVSMRDLLRARGDEAVAPAAP